MKSRDINKSPTDITVLTSTSLRRTLELDSGEKKFSINRGVKAS
jgi:hypothetical protein